MRSEQNGLDDVARENVPGAGGAASAGANRSDSGAGGGNSPGRRTITGDGVSNAGASGSQERDQLQSELKHLREEQKLLSKEASMAEVATATLHNVGNVLNSVNVSASLLCNRLRQSRVGNLGKALALLREHQEDLAGFLSSDPKGKVLPAYLQTLAEHLASEQTEMVQEVEALLKNVEHVKEIVAMQQSYARLCGVSETLQMSELVTDAIRMNQGAFERHSITLIRDFQPVPPVTVDKHKVLQILVNLIRNAKYAMDEFSPPEKRMTIRIALEGNGKVTVTISDNGIGIPAENISRIFNHGFTTRRDGHGFGLHSCLQAAHEMGGELVVRSEGPGKGAMFCLELPVSQAAPAAPVNLNPGLDNPPAR